MNKKNSIFIVILLFSLILQSCKNYYFLKHTPSIDGGTYAVHNLKFSDENIQFTMYGDYVYNKINKKLIYFNKKDIDNILKSHVEKPFTEQFLFMYTFIGPYNNLLGFYYENITLEEIKKYNINNQGTDLGNGILYTYNSGKFNVIDIFRKSDKGVVRFININNPKETDPNYKKFHREVNGLFFDLNKNLWDNPINLNNDHAY
ncbi:hypothetical protein BN1195_00816 [Chryseobacterium oranimense G311]|uniref:hypothetical protein n=1 Tax=Chryseobacterium oranimense TaxID=421058 RepID=UPI0005337D7D|nr:hypothetical protein [Chryseobacterium oranimense]CEJ68528.1 hypothetical protein BN1195_00816 [Chryseobacterium oranimense G311]